MINIGIIGPFGEGKRTTLMHAVMEYAKKNLPAVEIEPDQELIEVKEKNILLINEDDPKLITKPSLVHLLMLKKDECIDESDITFKKDDVVVYLKKRIKSDNFRNIQKLKQYRGITYGKNRY